MTKYIAIDGRGGSGKTYLSEALGKRLNAPVIHLDKYGSDFAPFVGIPVFIEVIEETQGNCVIFEGIGAFDERLDKFNALRVLADPPEQIRNRRIAARDIPRDDRDASDWRKIARIWTAAENEYFTDSLVAKAGILVDTLNTAADVDTIIDRLDL